MKFLRNPPLEQPAHAAMVLAHGAGAPMDSEFMERLTVALNHYGIHVFRFEFPYMAQRRLAEGKRRPPDKKAVLVDTWGEAVQLVSAELQQELPLLIGGKSMGGRIASMVADELGVSGVCCYGYPFHPPGRLDKMRTAHLEIVKTPILILQGTRDTFGKPAELSDLSLAGKVDIHWLEEGDHDFKPRKRSGLEQSQLIDEAALKTSYFIRAIS